ncbi:MAG: ribbon-helix-helix protein, CopG family [Actinobacteria bacterium]|nr:ribbon-helix-helix protein, CopG family [Actinomycetota bacterium]
MALYRAQILLEESQRTALEKLARESGRSMSELVRSAMDDYLTGVSEDESARRALAAIDELAEIRHLIEQKHGPLPATLLEELRDERDAEIAP